MASFLEVRIPTRICSTSCPLVCAVDSAAYPELIAHDPDNRLKRRETGGPEPDVAFNVSPWRDTDHFKGGVGREVGIDVDNEADDSSDDAEDADGEDEQDLNSLGGPLHLGVDDPGGESDQTAVYEDAKGAMGPHHWRLVGFGETLSGWNRYIPEIWDVFAFEEFEEEGCESCGEGK